MTDRVPTTEQAKLEAKALRRKRRLDGVDMTHAQALEATAQTYGFRDWNALSAAARLQTSRSWSVGVRVTGRYLSQPFAAEIIAADEVRPGWFRLVLDLATAVDVVQFDSFSNFRKQIRVVVGPEAFSKEQTSDGQPHVMLDRSERT